MPRSASTAWMRHLAAVASRPSQARWRRRARWSRTAWGAIHASGSSSARSSWASVWASTRSSLRRAEAIALGAAGMDQVRLKVKVLQQVDQPAQPWAASNATGVPAARCPRTGVSSAGSPAQVAIQSRYPCGDAVRA
jgi:hypothetical protein